MYVVQRRSELPHYNENDALYLCVPKCDRSRDLFTLGRRAHAPMLSRCGRSARLID